MPASRPPAIAASKRFEPGIQRPWRHGPRAAEGQRCAEAAGPPCGRATARRRA
eukprot:CAMPEP_0177618704 /NCGR_PEP_ID=MMETSP0419_2-20121207/25758_1 /TAXON_ID=582737 /ORGANISM="Tetraselmis sp., Strain GSL018" /LENGTH=52 /DNA_ID=CAMNT_0019117701 /DNA_START=8 /DNA_END=162 /DNA_ORIENTATION=-